MNKLFLLSLGLFVILLNSQTSFAQIELFEIHYETDDCLISFIDDSGERYVVKQIKDPSPDEQFLLVLDALGCHIARTSNIPMNQVTLLSPNTLFAGKMHLEYPATLHTVALGVSTDQESAYQNIDLHQRFHRIPPPAWHRWRPLDPEEMGLTLTIIQNMARHDDLPGIVALDTFVGNADRSSPNLFYDESTDHFCGIDMAASFNSPLASEACRQLRTLGKLALTEKEKLALTLYVHTLEYLIETWPPEKQEILLLDYGRTAGFVEGSPLFDQNVADRIEFHKQCIRKNYTDSIELVNLIKGILYLIK
jgi:hypothetical protein